MKILAIVADIEPNHLGGAESHFVEILKRLSHRLESATILVGRSSQIGSDFQRFPQVQFVPVNFPRIPNLFGLLYILFATPKAIFFALQKKPDLIWAKQEYPQAQIGAIVKLFTGTPLYVTSQNPQLAHEELVIKGNFPKEIKEMFANLVTFLIAWSFKKADVVAAVSHYSAQEARKLGARKVIVVPNGVDFARFRFSRSKISSQRRYRLITISSLIPRNGVETLISAFKLLPTNLSWQLTIAGGGPLLNHLKKMAKNLPISFLGRIENTKVPQLLRQSNVFVRSSRFEGFGSSFIEAMAAGVPVIGTPVGGIVDFIKDRQTGLLVPPDDPKMLAEAIQLLAKDHQLYSRLRANAQKLVARNYSWDNIAKRVWQIFKRLSK